MLSLLAGTAFGAFAGFVPGLLKAKFKVDEAVATILLNLPAVFFTLYLVSGPIKDRESPVPASPIIPSASWLPSFGSNGGFTSGVVVAAAMIVATWFLLTRTKVGLGIRVMGGNLKTAERMGVNTKRLTWLSMTVSGAFGGLAGSVLLQGVTHVLSDGISSGFGFTGIAVSALAGNNPLFLPFSALLFAVFTVGGFLASGSMGVANSFIGTITAVIIIVVLLKAYLRKSLAS